MKVLIAGIVKEVQGVEPLRRGFRQVIILHQPEINDDMERVKARQQYYPVTIWSTQQTDSRFIDGNSIGSMVKATCYLQGDRWFNERQHDYNYNVKLNLATWEEK